jgi:hypothetical protein
MQLYSLDSVRVCICSTWAIYIFFLIYNGAAGIYIRYKHAPKLICMYIFTSLYLKLGEADPGGLMACPKHQFTWHFNLRSTHRNRGRYPWRWRLHKPGSDICGMHIARIGCFRAGQSRLFIMGNFFKVK